MTETETVDNSLYCIGCGAKLQTTDPDAAGYLPEKSLQKAQQEGKDAYCKRCFRLRHYNEIQPVGLTDDDFLRLLNLLGKQDALIVNVVDIFDFNGSLIPGLHRFVGSNPVLLVGNKADVLPKSLKRTRLRTWLDHQAHDNGLHPVETILMSAKDKADVAELLRRIEKYREGRDVYFVGVTNTGKSTLINAILKQTTGVDDLITTSRFPGTTLDQIRLELEDGAGLIDTPGIIYRKQMAHYLDAKDLRLVSPTKVIRPRTYQLNMEQTLFLAGLARLDYVRGPRAGFTAYVDNMLLIHRTKLENADDFYDRQKGKMLQPPRADSEHELPPLVRVEFTPTEDSDIVFAGLGWISVPAGAVVAAYAPKGVDVVMRPAMI
ncbi:ribosome biogenesis GTPase YqeH [Lacticaseibacillus zhaodongensis]|uniref:ribosome biogenesis GTPase YqeH n=1 Tax=Lacticaseibacillus zhaodongensis TaxID=2668065 RepID=UPI0012D3365B|nr:ribosome biogenesis GTPase YqeH [Lacticaseibacillus zhaodongensis]